MEQIDLVRLNRNVEHLMMAVQLIQERVGIGAEMDFEKESRFSKSVESCEKEDVISLKSEFDAWDRAGDEDFVNFVEKHDL